MAKQEPTPPITSFPDWRESDVVLDYARRKHELEARMPDLKRAANLTDDAERVARDALSDGETAVILGEDVDVAALRASLRDAEDRKDDAARTLGAATRALAALDAETLPQIEQAKQDCAAQLQVAYLAALRDLAAALEPAVRANLRLADLYLHARSVFPDDSVAVIESDGGKHYRRANPRQAAGLSASPWPDLLPERQRSYIEHVDEHMRITDQKRTLSPRERGGGATSARDICISVREPAHDETRVERIPSKYSLWREQVNAILASKEQTR